MTKILLSVLALTLCLTISSSYSAYANDLYDVNIEADCQGYTITGLAVLLPGEYLVEYSSLLTYQGGSTIIVKSVQIATQTNIVDLPFAITDSWGELCEYDVVLETGTLKLINSNGGVHESIPLPSPDPIYIGDCPCDEEVCDPRTQGFWKRICDGATSFKRLHPETPDNFDTSLCPPLQIIGRERSNPCVRAEAQFAALQFNIMYGYLSEDCEVTLKGFDTVGDVVAEVEALIAAGGARNCKKAADLAEAVNSGKAL